MSPTYDLLVRGPANNWDYYMDDFGQTPEEVLKKAGYIYRNKNVTLNGIVLFEVMDPKNEKWVWIALKKFPGWYVSSLDDAGVAAIAKAARAGVDR